MPTAVRKFERAFAQWLPVRSAFAFWKGRVAMYAILKAMGIGEGDEVILPGYTCVMDVNPIKYLGAKPVYVDIEPVTYNMDVRLLEEKITPDTRLIVAQHTYGYPCEMDAIMDVAGRHGIPVVEDCCVAVRSTYKGTLCGTYGVAAYWSFQWNKAFTAGIGGMATTDDGELAGKIETICREQLRLPSSKAALVLSVQRFFYRLFIYPRTSGAATAVFRWLTGKGVLIGSSSAEEFAPTMPEGFFMGMSSGQGRAGLRGLRKIDRNIAHRRRMRAIYDRLLGEAGLDVAEIPAYMDPVLVRYPVRVADKQRALAAAPGKLLEIGSWFECPLHPIQTPMHLYDYQEGMCPVAERACREIINLPTHPRANERTARRSVEFVAEIGRPKDS